MQEVTLSFQLPFKPDADYSSGWKLVLLQNQCTVPENTSLLQDVYFGSVISSTNANHSITPSHCEGTAGKPFSWLKYAREFMHTSMYMCKYLCTWLSVYVYVCICVDPCMSLCTCVYFIHMPIWKYMCVPLHMPCIYVHLYVCILLCMAVLDECVSLKAV